jgi:hypothetical protein
MDWIGLAQDMDRCRALVNAVMNLRFLHNAGNFLTSCEPVSFLRRALLHGVSELASCDTQIGWNGVKWINLAQDRDKWRVVVNVDLILGGFLTSFYRRIFPP